MKKNDIKFEFFKRGKGKGGQALNKTSSAVRATHIPTGIVVESSEGRSQADNKELALEKLQTKLNDLAERAMREEKESAYNDKPDTSFSAQIRTYRLCGKNKNVLDHRTGISHPDSKKVLDGDIDRFLKG